MHDAPSGKSGSQAAPRAVRRGSHTPPRRRSARPSIARSSAARRGCDCEIACARRLQSAARRRACPWFSAVQEASAVRRAEVRSPWESDDRERCRPIRKSSQAVKIVLPDRDQTCDRGTAHSSNCRPRNTEPTVAVISFSTTWRALFLEVQVGHVGAAQQKPGSHRRVGHRQDATRRPRFAVARTHRTACRVQGVE